MRSNISMVPNYTKAAALGGLYCYLQLQNKNDCCGHDPNVTN